MLILTANLLVGGRLWIDIHRGNWAVLAANLWVGGRLWIDVHRCDWAVLATNLRVGGRLWIDVHRCQVVRFLVVLRVTTDTDDVENLLARSLHRVGWRRVARTTRAFCNSSWNKKSENSVVVSFIFILILFSFSFTLNFYCTSMLFICKHCSCF